MDHEIGIECKEEEDLEPNLELQFIQQEDRAEWCNEDAVEEHESHDELVDSVSFSILTFVEVVEEE